MPLLEAKKISHRFTYPATVDLFTGVSLEMEKGESIAIIGPSGQGKSTLLNILGTLEEPSDGELLLMGKNSQALKGELCSWRNRHIGFVFQAFHLLEDRTVLDNVLLPAAIARLDTSAKSTIRKRAHALLERVGLGHRTHFIARTLSGGEKQRTAIARALMQNPEIIIADEPTGNLDQANAAAIQTLLFECVEEKNRALIVATHSDKLASCCNQCFQLSNGQFNKIR